MKTKKPTKKKENVKVVTNWHIYLSTIMLSLRNSKPSLNLCFWYCLVACFAFLDEGFFVDAQHMLEQLPYISISDTCRTTLPKG